MMPPNFSLRKRAANVANARASTGPKTAQGKMCAAQNARRHGLNVPISRDPVLSAEAKSLARNIAGGGANAQKRELATRVAEAQIEVVRARRARYHVLARALNDTYYVPSRRLLKHVADLMRMVDLIDQGKEPPGIWSAAFRPGSTARTSSQTS